MLFIINAKYLILVFLCLMNKFSLVLLGAFGNLGVATLRELVSFEFFELISKIILIDVNIKKELIPIEILSKTKCFKLDLTLNDHLIELINLLNQRKEKKIVINLAAKDYPVTENMDKNDWNGFSPSGEQFLDVIRTNLLFPYELTREILISESTDLRLIHIGSIYGLRTPHPSLYSDYSHKLKPSPYSITKAGLISLMKYGALEFKRKRCECYMISFGGIKSEAQSKEFKNNYNRRVMSGSLMEPNNAVLAMLKLSFLPWGTASGSNLIIDNGYTIF